jgi:hypothetical protein
MLPNIKNFEDMDTDRTTLKDELMFGEQGLIPLYKISKNH